MEEVWKPVKSYEERYQISNFGRVKSFAQDKHTGKIKYGYLTKKGYIWILLYSGNGNKKWVPVHRLVADAFIPNPNGFDQINHKDENKTNNQVDNLEWCNNKYNHNYGTRNKRAGLANVCCKSTSFKIYSVDNTGKIEYYNSIGEAERQTGCSHSNIVRTLKGRTKRCGNKQWFYC